MDPLTHLLATRLLIGRKPATLLAGIAPDLAFYSTYPLWALRSGHVRAVLDGQAWPAPPLWMVRLHRVGHSIPIALLGAVLIRLSNGRWPRQLLGAYLLHLLIEISTHARDPWGAAPTLASLEHRLRWCQLGRGHDQYDSGLATWARSYARVG